VREASGARLRGSIGAVPFGRYAVTVAVPIEGQLALVPAKGIKWTQGKSYSGDACDAADLNLTVAAVGKLPLSADALGALMRSFQMAGAMKTVLAMTLQYANDRVQFGRALGKFQALQHMLAEMAENAAAAETAANNALRAWGSPTERLLLAAAKIRCGEAAGIVAAGAHQLHGAIGFTREHRLHHLTRRLYTWRDEFGHEGDWAIELGRAALARGPDALWPLITDA
jgi:alkylation response protein AidB-like acyl-CoA dehydrogenase